MYTKGYIPCIHRSIMDGKPLWIEAMSDEDLFALNDILNEKSMNEGFYIGKTETRFWKIYVQVVDECQLRNKLKGW